MRANAQIAQTCGRRGAGKKREAYAILEGGAEVADTAEELMLAADAARSSGHPTAALTYLRRVLSEHRDDPRAPLAAFTIGRIELARRRYAAAVEHFELVGREYSGSALAEHALAREVEALIAAGEREKARASAARYLQRYPSGSRVEQIRQLTRGAR